MLPLLVVSLFLIAAGLFRVVNVYERYRESMLLYESRHLESIASSGAQSIDWILNAYDGQVEDFTHRREFLWAEETYLENGDPAGLWWMMSRPDLLRPTMSGFVAVFSPQGGLLALSGTALPLESAEDVPMGTAILRADEAGDYLFIFTAESSLGFRYEYGLTVRSAFAYLSEVSRVGQNGILFLLDRSGHFLSYAGSFGEDTCSEEELLSRFPALDPSVLKDLRTLDLRREPYYVARLPWSKTAEADETLVVMAPVIQSGNTLMLGTAVSFREFDSFLSDMLQEVTGVFLLEIGGVLILFFLAGWVLLVNRRNSLELAAVRERADLMEEINRQQQSLAHTERLQQLGVMTSGIVHEFNNLLTPIMGQSMLLLEELADQEETPAFDCALDIYEASENAR